MSISLSNHKDILNASLLVETEKKIVISAKLVSMYTRGCQHHIIFLVSGHRIR
jgi:hypothetical protein